MAKVKINVGHHQDGKVQAVTSRKVEAQIFGHWAVHETVDTSIERGKWKGWTITHVPTGLKANAGLTKRLAIAGARALRRELNVEEWKTDHGPAARDIMLKVGAWP